MKDAIEAFLNFFLEFTWPRIRAVLILLIIVVIGIFCYDAYTSAITYGRLQKAAELILTLQEIEESTIKRSHALEETYQTLLSRTKDAIIPKPWTIASRTNETSQLLKFFAGGGLWFAISLMMIPQITRKNGSGLSGIFVTLTFGCIFGGIGMLLPTIFWPWFNLIIYPSIPFFGLFGVVGYLAYRTAVKSGKTAPSKDIPT